MPQIVVIDRKGMIRAQSRPVRELNLEDENYLRNLIGDLLIRGHSGSKQEKSIVSTEELDSRNLICLPSLPMRK